MLQLNDTIPEHHRTKRYYDKRNNNIFQADNQFCILNWYILFKLWRGAVVKLACLNIIIRGWQSSVRQNLIKGSCCFF